MAVPLDFPFPISLLLTEARHVVAAAQDPAHRDALATRLSARVPNFVGEVGTLTEIVEAAHSGSLTQRPAAVGGMTADVDDLVHQMNDLVRGAKNSARLAFHGEDAKLREQFLIGINKPRNLAAVLARARVVANACAEGHNESALAFEGWTSTDTAELQDVVATLENAEAVKTAGSTTRVRTTGDPNADANVLYADVRTLQNAASLLYPASNPTNAASRARFRLGVFPPAATGATAPKMPGEAPATPAAGVLV